MTTEEELQGFRRTRYFARAWALLTRDRGWIKPVLVMTVALFVPIVGALGVLGYVLEWARLTAWGASAAPKQKRVRVGACIASGWRAFVVALVWSVCITFIGALIDHLPLIGGLLSLPWDIFSIFLNLLIMVAVLRATIYQKISAGFRVSTIWRMGTHDVGGLARVLGIICALAACAGVVGAMIGLSSLLSALPELMWAIGSLFSFDSYYLYSYYWGGDVLAVVLRLLSAMGPTILLLLLLAFLSVVLICMMSYTALALWVRQFDVPAWGRDEDPLPPFVDDPADSAHGMPRQSWDVPRETPAVDVVVETVDETPRPTPAPAPAPEEPSAPEPEHEPIPMPAAAPDVVAAAEGDAAAQDGPTSEEDAPTE